MTTENKPQKTQYYYKLFRVRRGDGRVTTVSVDPALVAVACRSMGSLKAVSNHVRQAALTYEDGTGKNCSNFVSNSLRKVIEAPRKSAASEPAMAA